MADAHHDNDLFLIKLDHDLVPPTPEAPTRFEVKKLQDPYTTMLKLIDNQWGPCPLATPEFPMHGGALTIEFSASVHTDTTIPSGSIAQVGYELFVDGVSVGTARTFTSQANMWGYVSTVLVVEGLSVDNHVITVQPWGPYTSNDQFNLFNLTVLEF